MKLAVIPARGGSKRIPRKNIKLFAGKPMIAWSIEAAQRTGLFDRIVVSTDDEEIASIARKYGADVPFVRPAELSDDYTGTAPVIAHAIEWHLKRGLDPIEICCIYATAPFLRSEDIILGQETLDQSGVDFAFSVTLCVSIQRAIKLRDDGRIEMFDPSQFKRARKIYLKRFMMQGSFIGVPETPGYLAPILVQNRTCIFTAISSSRYRHSRRLGAG